MIYKGEPVAGIEPGQGKLSPPLTIDDVTRLQLRRWCITQGISPKWTITAKDYQLSACYREPAYTEKMIALTLAGKLDDTGRGKRGRGGYAEELNLDEFEEDPPSIAAKSPPPKRETPNLFTEPKDPPSPHPEGNTSSQQLTTTTEAINRAADQVISSKLNDLERRLMASIVNGISVAARAEADRMKLSDRVKQQIRDLARDSAEAVLRDHLPVRVEVTSSQLSVPKDLGLQHFKFAQLLRLVNARGINGHGLNIWMTGPTGSGKTTAAENVAKALTETGSFSSYTKDESGRWTIPTAELNGLIYDSPFGADSSLDADYKVTGYDKADGSFRWTTFLRIFCYGGVYVMDEIDNWNPSALVAANAPLANGWVSTPAGIFRRHPDCRIVAAANTWGLGATSDYVGRTKLDAATTDRFPNKIEWPYDERLERALAEAYGGLIGLAWFDIVRQVRAQAKAQGLQVIFSPRKTYDGIAVILAGEPIADVIEMNLKSGLKPEHITALGIDRLAIPEILRPRPKLTEVEAA